MDNGQQVNQLTSQRASATPERRLLVVVHDVAPQFADELHEIGAALTPLLGDQLVAAVVPRWHGNPAPHDVSEFRRLLGSYGELLLHGWTHRRERGAGVVSRLTGRSDEFSGLARDQIQQRIDAGQEDLARLAGHKVAGFLPPAWQLPVPAQRLDAIDFVVGFSAIQSCRDDGVQQPLATWSWDWGRLGRLAAWGACLGSLRQWTCRAAVPCLAIHPADVQRNLLPRATRLIGRLLDSGHRPCTASSVLATATGIDAR